MEAGMKVKPNLKDYNSVDLQQEHQAVRVTPIREPKEIRFALEAGTCESRKRVQSYNAGDAIVKDRKLPGDAKDYYYPILRSKFESLYEPTSDQKIGEDGYMLRKRGKKTLRCK